MNSSPLAGLSKEQKLALYDAIQEKKRRIRASESVYTPNDGQILVHKSPKTTRAVFSGNGAGKTCLGANEAIWWLKGFNPVLQAFTKVPSRTIVVLDHPEKVTDLWLPELMKWTNFKEDDLHKRGKPYISQITQPNGSEIIFMFHDASPLMFESIEADNVIFDEPPSRNIWIAMQRAGRKKHRTPKYLVIATPISGSWLRTEVYDPWAKGESPDVECFKFGTAVNEKNLADGYIDRFKSVLSEKEQRIRLEGEFFDLEGLALAHLFKRTTHIIQPYKWPDTNNVVVAIDPHPSKAHHAVMLGATKDGGLVYIKELKAKCVARDFAGLLKKFYEGYRVIDITSDCLGSSEMTGGEGFKSFIQVLNEEGVRARATNWTEKSDADFMQRIQDCLLMPEQPNNFGHKIPKLQFFDGNYGIMRDVENVTWQKFRDVDQFKPKLDITNCDFLSCLKYALATNLTFDKTKAKIYRSTRGAETYGTAKKKSIFFYRKKLLEKKRFNTSGKDDADEDW